MSTPTLPDTRDLETDALANLGKILPRPLAKDAVHLAVFSAQVHIDLIRGGIHVGLKNGMVSPLFTPYVGVIDPFLNQEIPKGSYVQVFLYPRTITTVRHMWDHPHIDAHLPNKDA